MIEVNISDLKPEDCGRGVVYAPQHGPREDGVIVRWNEDFIFVRYAGSETPKATNPADLEWTR
jgi:hypothetical protein